MLLVASLVLFGAGSGLARGGTAAQASARPGARCDATLVHYRPYKGVETGLSKLPWIAIAPASTGLVGHLFYYDRSNVWKQMRLPRLRIYSGGESPDGRINMKILWELRRGSAMVLRLQGRRLDGSGSFSEPLSSTSSNPRQFPSIVSVPTPGCWRLTLKTGKTTGHVSVLVVPGRTR